MSSPSPKVAELATHEGSTALIGHDQGHARPGAINNGRAWLATLRRRYFFMGHGYLSSLVRSLKSADLVTQRLAEQEWNNFQQSQASRDPPRAIHIDTITLSDRKDFQLWRAKVLEELSPKIIDKAVGDTWREKVAEEPKDYEGATSADSQTPSEAKDCQALCPQLGAYTRGPEGLGVQRLRVTATTGMSDDGREKTRNSFVRVKLKEGDPSFNSRDHTPPCRRLTTDWSTKSRGWRCMFQHAR